jgi:hypothetical protein
MAPADGRQPRQSKCSESLHERSESEGPDVAGSSGLRLLIWGNRSGHGKRSLLAAAIVHVADTRKAKDHHSPCGRLGHGRRQTLREP